MAAIFRGGVVGSRELAAPESARGAAESGAVPFPRDDSGAWPSVVFPESVSRESTEDGLPAGHITHATVEAATAATQERRIFDFMKFAPGFPGSHAEEGRYAGPPSSQGMSNECPAYFCCNRTVSTLVSPVLVSVIVTCRMKQSSVFGSDPVSRLYFNLPPTLSITPPAPPWPL